MIEYPKIETLYNRDERTHKVVPDQLRMPEFGLVREWYVTEKVDGTNVRVCLNTMGKVTFGGRTDNAQMHVSMIDYLQNTFTKTKMLEAFGDEDYGVSNDVALFGEGYGEKIQKGGLYRKGVSFRLFDVKVGDWWLEPWNIKDVAYKLGILAVPCFGIIQDLPTTISGLEHIITHSFVAEQDGGPGCQAEGIVARTMPLLLTRRGDRVMWKLKFSDF